MKYIPFLFDKLMLESDLYGCKVAVLAEIDDDVVYAKASFTNAGYNRSGEENHQVCEKIVKNLLTVYPIITAQQCSTISTHQESEEIMACTLKSC